LTLLIPLYVNYNYTKMELLKIMIETIDLLAKILGFVALYAIAIALTDWRKTERYKRNNEQR
jgi:hypothetical protein